jgi:hypothetical protein
MDELDEEQIDLDNSKEDFTQYDVMTLCDLVEEYREDILTAEKDIITLSDELSAAKIEILSQSNQLAESQRHIDNLEESVCVLDEEWAVMDDTLQQVLCLLDARSSAKDILKGLREVMGVHSHGEDTDIEENIEDSENEEKAGVRHKKDDQDKKILEEKGENLSINRLELQEAREEIKILKEKDKDRKRKDFMLVEREAKLNDEVKLLKHKLQVMQRESEEAKVNPMSEIDSTYNRSKSDGRSKYDRDNKNGIASVHSNDEEEDERQVVVTLPHRRNRLAAPGTDRSSIGSFRSYNSNDGNTSMISNDDSVISTDSAYDKTSSTGLFDKEFEGARKKGLDYDDPEKPLLNQSIHSPSKVEFTYFYFCMY